MDFKIAALLFILQIIIDAAYCVYTKAVSEGKPFQAAASGFTIHFFLAVGVINYVQNYLYVIPIALGSFVGTYCTLKFTEIKN